MRWQFERKLDDYNKSVIKINIKVSNYTEKLS